ncbi:MAG: UDP-N-acetylmuramate dehydrogenase [Acidimicrobiia bacterium]|nr:UDP-N-acetylmuramate dehydrogenase [Acidimicrobiia bacterium]
MLPAAEQASIEAVALRLGPLAVRDEPLGVLTTYRVGGPAALAVRAERAEHLAVVAEALVGLDVPVLVVGRGSNLLVADAGFGGVAVLVGEGLAQVDIDGVRVRAGGGASLPVVARRTAAAGLRGFEWAVGVPGSIGGAVRMNAGGHGSDMAATLERVRLFDLRSGEDEEVTADTLDLGYRRSSVTPDQVVLEAHLGLTSGDRAAAEAEVAGIVRWRRAHQPGGANAGSVFANPAGDSAGRLIDEAGLRGFRRGTAEISAKHANFIQATPDGSADDIVALMRHVQQVVTDRAGVSLAAETRLVGFPGTLGGPPGDPPVEQR